MNSKGGKSSKKFNKHDKFFMSLIELERIRERRCRTKDLTYAAALRRLTINKLQTPGFGQGDDPCELFQVVCERDNSAVRELFQAACERSNPTATLDLGSKAAACKLFQVACEPENSAVRELFQAVCEQGDPVCELCGEAVSRRKGFMDRRFGILENCSHVFCLVCIRAYRQLALVREQSAEEGRESCRDPPLSSSVGCPVCGAASSLVSSSQTWIRVQEARRHHLGLFREEMSSMPCPWMQCGQGQCMFPDRCAATEDL